MDSPIEGYRLIEQIAGNPFSDAYIGLDLATGEKVFIKRFEPSAKKRFYKELEAHLNCQHERVLPLRNFLFDSEDSPCLFFEFLPLRDWRLYAHEFGDLDDIQNWLIILDIVCALDALHQVGYVHGDIKPDNILLCQQADRLVTRAYLSDLGCADSLRNITQTRLLPLGTSSYHAPEFIAAEYSERSDLYSLGVTLYRMLVDKSFDDPSASNKDIDLGMVGDTQLRDLISSLTERDPYYRTSNTSALMRWLQKNVLQFDPKLGYCQQPFTQIISNYESVIPSQPSYSLESINVINKSAKKYLIVNYPHHTDIFDFNPYSSSLTRVCSSLSKTQFSYVGEDPQVLCAIGLNQGVDVLKDDGESFIRSFVSLNGQRPDHLHFNDGWILWHFRRSWYLKNTATGEISEFPCENNYFGTPVGSVRPSGVCALSVGSCNEQISIVSMCKEVVRFRFEGAIENITPFLGGFLISEKSLTGISSYRIWYYDSYTKPERLAESINIVQILSDGITVFLLSKTNSLYELKPNGSVKLLLNLEFGKSPLAATKISETKLALVLKDKQKHISEIMLFDYTAEADREALYASC